MAAKTFLECCVYGVAVPGNEGKAGMLALCCGDIGARKDDPDAWEVHLLSDLLAAFKANLPVYAHPLFVRFVDQVDMTG